MKFIIIGVIFSLAIIGVAVLTNEPEIIPVGVDHIVNLSDGAGIGQK